MSHLSPRSSHAQRATFVGLPTGSGIAIIFAALFTGVLLSVYGGLIGWPFLALFAAATLLVTTLVNPKGLYLTVASAPILFVLGLLVAGWFIARGNATTEGPGVSKASVLAIIYPTVEYFPVLAAVTAGSLAIAFLRIALIKRQNAALQRRDRRERTRAAASNRRTNRQSRRARERTNTVTVDELLRRRNETGAQRTRRPRRSLGDDLYNE